jgi:hypothetical protein
MSMILRSSKHAMVLRSGKRVSPTKLKKNQPLLLIKKRPYQKKRPSQKKRNRIPGLPINFRAGQQGCGNAQCPMCYPPQVEAEGETKSGVTGLVIPAEEVSVPEEKEMDTEQAEVENKEASTKTEDGMEVENDETSAKKEEMEAQWEETDNTTAADAFDQQVTQEVPEQRIMETEQAAEVEELGLPVGEDAIGEEMIE